jgi:hypothetical protein
VGNVKKNQALGQKILYHPQNKKKRLYACFVNDTLL